MGQDCSGTPAAGLRRSDPTRPQPSYASSPDDDQLEVKLSPRTKTSPFEYKTSPTITGPLCMRALVLDRSCGSGGMEFGSHIKASPGNL